jgi:cytochrome c oxidase subunit 3
MNKPVFVEQSTVYACFTSTMTDLLIKRKDPYQFMLYLALIGSGLMFLFLSVSYFLLQGGPRWDYFKMPKAFWGSTVLITSSSVTLQLAKTAFFKDNFLAYRSYIGITLLLGSLFLLMQFSGWQALQAQGVFMQKSTAGAFLYIISGFHAVHIVVGILLLLITFLKAIQRNSYVDSFVYSVNPPNQLRLRMIAVYWHFVDVVWVYLFLFFLYHHS